MRIQKNKLKETLNHHSNQWFYLIIDKLMKKINIKKRLIDLEKDSKQINKLTFK